MRCAATSRAAPLRAAPPSRSAAPRRVRGVRRHALNPGIPPLPFTIYKENHPSPCIFTRRTTSPLVYSQEERLFLATAWFSQVLWTQETVRKPNQSPWRKEGTVKSGGTLTTHFWGHSGGWGGPHVFPPPPGRRSPGVRRGSLVGPTPHTKQTAPQACGSGWRSFFKVFWRGGRMAPHVSAGAASKRTSGL